jgi:hypothetical protein
MAKRRTVVLPDYPEILLTPGYFRGKYFDQGKAYEELLDALFQHYDIGPAKEKESERVRVRNILGRDDDHNERMARLAWRLMLDLLPAFHEPRKVGKPKQDHTQKEYQFPHAHEARLVQIVDALRRMLKERKLPSTRAAAYNQLLKILKRSPAPLWRYGKLTKATAFQQEWKAIPKDVQDNPNSYFPLHLPQWDYPLALHLEVVAAGRGRSILAMEHMAAYMKRSSMERLFEILPRVPSELPK